MKTHNIPFSIQKKKNYTKLSQICRQGFVFLGTEERVRNNRGKRAISVRAIEVLLYMVCYRDCSCVKFFCYLDKSTKIT